MFEAKEQYGQEKSQEGVPSAPQLRIVAPERAGSVPELTKEAYPGQKTDLRAIRDTIEDIYGEDGTIQRGYN